MFLDLQCHEKAFTLLLNFLLHIFHTDRFQLIKFILILERDSDNLSKYKMLFLDNDYID